METGEKGIDWQGQEAVAYLKSRMNDLEKGILVKFAEVLQKAVGIH